jgi:hypothetical protein
MASFVPKADASNRSKKRSFNQLIRAVKQLRREVVS